MAAKIYFQSDDLKIEGLVEERTADKGVVVSHPHPLYGGDMYAAGVESIVHAYWKKGYTTLRFNFRGVGGSQGAYGDGVGEQQDLLAALAYLQTAGFESVEIAGYSFGSWVNARAAVEAGVDESQIMVSPPVAFLNFTGVTALPGLRWAVTGERDEIAPSDMVTALTQRLNPAARVAVIPGADHFYSGALSQLERVLADAL